MSQLVRRIHTAALHGLHRVEEHVVVCVAPKREGIDVRVFLCQREHADSAGLQQVDHVCYRAFAKMLVEGNSVRATSRMAGVAINTVQKLILDIGEAAAAYQDEHLRDLDCKTIEADEIWSFVYSKARNVPEDRKDEFGVGDVWTWTALDATRS